MTPCGYQLKQSPRNKENVKRGGGIAILCKQTLDIKMVTTKPTVTFEYLKVTITTSGKTLRLLTIYRPPRSQKNQTTIPAFIAEFGDFLAEYTACSAELLIMGDFNIHLDVRNDANAIAMNELLESLNLQQHIHEPTHIKGHTLDLVISRQSDEPFLTNIRVCDTHFSDHFAITLDVALSKPAKPTKVIKYRKLKTIDIDKFVKDIKNSELITNPSESLPEMVSQYDSVLRNLLDKHAPVIEKCIVLRPQTPWYTEDLLAKKRHRRRLESKWRKSKLEVDRQIYKEQCDLVNLTLDNEKTRYYSELIISNNNDQKELFNIVDKLLHRKTIPPLPNHDTPEELANRFSDFFTDQIAQIRTSLVMNGCRNW
jgi:hypothetical protein